MEVLDRMDVQIRWLIRRDMADVLSIENASFEFPWTEGDFLSCLRQRNAIGMVAEHQGHIVGFMLYELHAGRLVLLNLAVDPSHRRQQVGLQMINKLTGKLSHQRRTQIDTEVRESNLTAQLFFRASGFEAVAVRRNAYDDTDESAYAMRYSLEYAVPTWNHVPRFDLGRGDA